MNTLSHSCGWISAGWTLAFALALAAGGCAGSHEESGDGTLRPIAPGVYTYTAYNETGATVLEGRLALQVDASGEISGTWRLAATGSPRDLGPQVGDGPLTGHLEGDSATIALNPGWADNNVDLRGRLGTAQFEGTWTWTTFTGPRTHGTFIARRDIAGS